MAEKLLQRSRWDFFYVTSSKNYVSITIINKVLTQFLTIFPKVIYRLGHGRGRGEHFLRDCHTSAIKKNE